MDSGSLLYRRYLDGDDEAMVELIRVYKDGLILYLNGITSNLSLAEELMEDTFFKLAAKNLVFREKVPSKHGFIPLGATQHWTVCVKAPASPILLSKTAMIFPMSVI
ncbi:hypothetical protein [Ruminococcus sp.]